MKKYMYFVPLLALGILAIGYHIGNTTVSTKPISENTTVNNRVQKNVKNELKSEVKTSSGSKVKKLDIAPNSSNIDPVIGDSTSKIKLPDFISAQAVLKEVKSDLNDANFNCSNSDPKKNPLIILPGSESEGTLASCSMGDPEDDGFILFVVTDKNFVSKYNSEKYLNYFREFQSPIDGLAENALFTPSLRAILFVLGGKNAFPASEIAWGTLDSMQLEPPSRE